VWISTLPKATLGRVVGAVTPLQAPLTSPLGGHACVYYLATVTTWGEERSVPAAIADASGWAHLDVVGSEMVLAQDYFTTSGPLYGPTANELASSPDMVSRPIRSCGFAK
jgi:hypothetical protein